MSITHRPTPDQWFNHSERNDTLLDGCTIYWSNDHLDHLGWKVIVVHRDASPWKDRPYAVLVGDGKGRFYDGEYDLTLEQAIKERDRRSRKAD